MFGLFRKARKAPPTVPDGMRIYAIGDVHGRADLLRALLSAIADHQASDPAAQPVLIFLGDYVDRGADSKGVLDLVRAGLPGFERVALLGNHEQLMLDFLETGQPMNWIVNGGDATLESYGLDRLGAYGLGLQGDAPVPELRQAFARVLPQEHLDFLRGLSVCHEEGGYLFVHAGVRPGIALKHQDPQDLIWIREPFLRAKKSHGAVVVHGHSVRYQPEAWPDPAAPVRIGIDTGAYATDTLTALVLQSEERGFLQADPKGVRQGDFADMAVGLADNPY